MRGASAVVADVCLGVDVAHLQTSELLGGLGPRVRVRARSDAKHAVAAHAVAAHAVAAHASPSIGACLPLGLPRRALAATRATQSTQRALQTRGWERACGWERAYGWVRACGQQAIVAVRCWSRTLSYAAMKCAPLLARLLLARLAERLPREADARGDRAEWSRPWHQICMLWLDVMRGNVTSLGHRLLECTCFSSWRIKLRQYARHRGHRRRRSGNRIMARVDTQ